MDILELVKEIEAKVTAEFNGKQDKPIINEVSVKGGNIVLTGHNPDGSPIHSNTGRTPEEFLAELA
ncbi:MAG: hypothetical protein WBK77_09025 [Alphaproteobacteria bacterium]